MSRIISAIGRHLADRARAIVPEVVDTTVAKIGQGATEISNAAFSQSNAYSPVTADKAADNARRAQFQNRDQSKGLER